MSKTGASPEFERKMQEIAEKTTHMVIPRSKVQTPITEPRYPAWTEEPTTPTPMIPMEAIEAAAIALAAASEHWFRKGSYRSQARLVLEAAAPYMLDRAQIQVEVLTHARAVITQWLSTAEKWRYDQVCADFQEMIDAAADGQLTRATHGDD